VDRPSPYLTTAEAAKYLRFGSASSIRMLVFRGELLPSGAGSKGTLLFRIEELDRFVQQRLRGRGYSPETEDALAGDVQVYRPFNADRRQQRRRLRMPTIKSSPIQPVGEELGSFGCRVPSITSPPSSSPAPRSRSGDLLRGAARKNSERAPGRSDKWGLREIVERVHREQEKARLSEEKPAKKRPY
jgi:hypothetical protein